MKTLPAIALDILNEQKCVPFEMHTFMNHIVITIPEEENIRTSIKGLEDKVSACLNEHLPQRDAEILFEVSNENEQHSFKVYKQIGG